MVTYAFSPLTYPGSVGTTGWAINDSGQVVGGYSDGTTGLAFLYSDGQYSTLGLTDWISSSAFGISNNGSVFGGYYDGSISADFVYSNGNYVTLADPYAASGDTFPNAISNAGV